MKARALATLSVLALTAAFATQPALSQTGAGTTMSYDLSTRQFDVSSAGEYVGDLHLTITPDGIVSGRFINSDAQVTPVVGGLTGKKIWLEIGGFGRLGHNHFTGTFADGKLEATAPAGGLHVWNLEGKPITH